MNDRITDDPGGDGQCHYPLDKARISTRDTFFFKTRRYFFLTELRFFFYYTVLLG
jgi:hypothetical protein